jgi:hypothetical protein
MKAFEITAEKLRGRIECLMKALDSAIEIHYVVLEIEAARRKLRGNQESA